MKKWLVSLPAFFLLCCGEAPKQEKATTTYPTIGSLEKLDSSLDNLISPGARAEIIAEGLDWSEGPVWVESQHMLLFSDVPRDTIFKWTEENGKEIYLTPSGYTDTVKRGGEMGSNGLLLDAQGRLILCQCGNRQLARMDAPLDHPAPNYIALANRFNGKKFNSPNDAVFNDQGELFFTDPPYGLEKGMEDPKKEIPFQGIYRVSPTGEVTLVTDSITRPNGIGIFPGTQKMLIGCSDPGKPYWYLLDLAAKDGNKTPSVFYSAANQGPEVKGLPDGLKIDSHGNVFASGPGGIWFFNREGKLLGRYHLTEAASNCALSADEKTLYITNDMYVLRLKLHAADAPAGKE